MSVLRIAVELEGRFIKIIDERTHQWDGVTFAEADGVMFLCPKCWHDNGGPVGTHSVICWAPHVGPEHFPGPGRWKLTGTGLSDLTLVAGSSSVLLTSGCRAHFYVRNGAIVDC